MNNIDLRKLAQIICEVFEIEDITQAATPDGRWQILQGYIESRPRWKRNITRWAQMPTEAAYSDLQEYICRETGVKMVFLKMVVSPEIGARIIAAISTIQTLYRDRAGMGARKELRA